MNKLTMSQIESMVESTEDFPVSLDDAWKWIGYQKKQNAKDALTAAFEEGLDFLRSSVKSSTGGRPSDLIYLSTDCFKQLSMMANTEKGREIRRYFIECEKRFKQLCLELKNRSQSNAADLESRLRLLELQMESLAQRQTSFRQSQQQAQLPRSMPLQAIQPPESISDFQRKKNQQELESLSNPESTVSRNCRSVARLYTLRQI